MVIYKCEACGKKVKRQDDERFVTRCLRHLCNGKTKAIHPRPS